MSETRVWLILASKLLGLLWVVLYFGARSLGSKVIATDSWLFFSLGTLPLLLCFMCLLLGTAPLSDYPQRAVFPAKRLIAVVTWSGSILSLLVLAVVIVLAVVERMLPVFWIAAAQAFFSVFLLVHLFQAGFRIRVKSFTPQAIRRDMANSFAEARQLTVQQEASHAA